MPRVALVATVRQHSSSSGLSFAGPAVGPRHSAVNPRGMDRCLIPALFWQQLQRGQDHAGLTGISAMHGFACCAERFLGEALR